MPIYTVTIIFFSRIRYIAIGYCHVEKNDNEAAEPNFGEALRILDQAEVTDENDAERLTIQGMMHNIADEKDEALECYGQALDILKKVSDTFHIPTLTDIHEASDAALAAQYVDVLQIPAFLVRQTDLVVAAAKTGKVVNLKKGQFMSPEAMKHAVQKVKDSGNEKVWITDRGTMFGYQDMIVDFRGIPTMKQFAPTVLDVTHSLQKPNQTSGVTGGLPEMIETIARAGIVNEVDGLFIETHFDPKNALSDGKNMLPIKSLEKILSRLISIRKTINSFKS